MSHETKPEARKRRFVRRTLTMLVALLAAFAVGAVAAPAANAAIIPGRCEYSANQPTIRWGATGPSVKQMQCELNNSLRYTKIAEDGSYGPATYNAVTTFQRCVALTPDGIVGPLTWQGLNAWASSNDWVEC